MARLVQFALALLILKTTPGRLFFKGIGAAFDWVTELSDKGSVFVFGESFKEHFFAFKVLPTIIFFSSLATMLYYMGIIHERRAKSQLRAGHLPHTLLVTFEEAMRCFEEAQKLSPSANDDAILHWNTCVRLLQSRADSDWHREHQEIEGIDAGDSQPMYSKK